MIDLNEATDLGEMLALALDGEGMATFFWDVPSGRVTMDPRWIRNLGYALEELNPVMDAWNELVHPDDLPRIANSFEKHQKGIVPFYDFEGRVRHKAGHWVWMLGKGRIVSETPRITRLKLWDFTWILRTGGLADLQIRQLANEQSAILKNGRHGNHLYQKAQGGVDQSRPLLKCSVIPARRKAQPS